jgi:hypothetical protein
MGLSEDDFAAIDQMLAAGANAAGLADFRQRFPGLSLTRCDAADVDTETPFREYPGLSLFLVDAHDHCWRITSDPARATGIVVARHKARL